MLVKATRLNTITRANPHLEEIIEYLDNHLALNKGNVDIARSRLSAADNEWIDEELFQCMTKPRYFISNYFAYRDEKEGFKGLYPFFDSQEILHDAYREMEQKFGRVRAIVLKARQMGSTTYNCAEFFQKTIFSEHTKSLIAGNDQTLTSEIMGFYESALDFIPWWMRPRIKSKTSGEYLEYDEKDDAIRAIRPGLKSSIQALNANKPSGIGRGQTFGRALLSELAFWQDGKQLSKSLFPTFNTPDGFYVMESTANGRNNFWHNLWRSAEAGDVDWNPVFIPFYRRAATYSIPIPAADKAGFVLTKEENDIRIRIQKKEDFLISDETFNWMRKRKEEFVATDGDDTMFSQEYTMTAEESFQASVVTAFPRGIIRRYTARVMNPLWVGEINFDHDKGMPKRNIRDVGERERVAYPKLEDRFHMWAKPEGGCEYAMGVDVSLGNDGGDYSCIQVVKKGVGHQLDEQVAVWHGLIDPERLADIILAIGMYYNFALAAVEVNNMGITTNNKLVRVYEYDNVYRFKRMDRMKNYVTDIIGWWTDYKSKRALISKMTTMMLDDQIIIRDRFTMDEFPDFTVEGAEEDGAHDDFVMALMIAVYCLHEGEVPEKSGNRSREAAENANKFKVIDRDGMTIILETTSQLEAERMSIKRIGSTIERSAGATANVNIKGKNFKVPADYANTEFSPIHDKTGTAHKLYYDEGMDAEDITPDAIAEYDEEQEALETENDKDAWKYA